MYITISKLSIWRKPWNLIPHGPRPVWEWHTKKQLKILFFRPHGNSRAQRIRHFDPGIEGYEGKSSPSSSSVEACSFKWKDVDSSFWSREDSTSYLVKFIPPPMLKVFPRQKAQLHQWYWNQCSSAHRSEHSASWRPCFQ